MEYEWEPKDREIPQKKVTRYKDCAQNIPMYPEEEVEREITPKKSSDPTFNLYCPLDKLHKYHIIEEGGKEYEAPALDTPTLIYRKPPQGSELKKPHSTIPSQRRRCLPETSIEIIQPILPPKPKPSPPKPQPEPQPSTSGMQAKRSPKTSPRTSPKISPKKVLQVPKLEDILERTESSSSDDIVRSWLISSSPDTSIKSDTKVDAKVDTKLPTGKSGSPKAKESTQDDKQTDKKQDEVTTVQSDDEIRPEPGVIHQFELEELNDHGRRLIMRMRKALLKRWNEFHFYRDLDWTPQLLMILIVCSFGMVEFGYQTIIMSVLWRAQSRWLDEWWWTWRDKENDPQTLWFWKEYTSASYYTVFCLGASLGAFRSRYNIQRRGVKRALMLGAFYASVAHACMCVTNLLHWITLLFLGRLLTGVYAGLMTVTCPLYLLEATRADMRAQCFAIMATGFSVGFCMATIAGHRELLGRLDHLDLCMSISIPAFWIQFLLAWRCTVVGPRQLYVKDARIIAAIAVTENIVHRRLKVEEIIMECKREVNYAMACFHRVGPCKTFENVLAATGLRKPLWICVQIQMVAHIAYHNVFMGTCLKILDKRGYRWEVMAPRLMVIAGVTLLIGSLLTFKLINIFGRKTLLLSGLIGMASVQVYLTCVLTYISDIKRMELYYNCGVGFLMLFYAIGPLVIPPLYTVEMFTQDCRFTSVCFSVSVGWFFSALLTVIYPLCDYYLGSMVLVPGTLFSLWAIIFVATQLVETKGKSLIEISEEFRVQKYDQLLNIYSISAARTLIERMLQEEEARWWAVIEAERDADQARSALLMEEITRRKREDRLARGLGEEFHVLPEIKIDEPSFDSPTEPN